MRETLTEGQLVKIKVLHNLWSSDGFATCSPTVDGQARIFEVINLNSYPSSNDFHGESIEVSDGDNATVIRYVGRPMQIRHAPQFFEYDVYDVLLHGKVYQIMKNNLEVVNVDN